MADGEEKSMDFYAVMGLNKECSSLELRSAYKKLAMRWHPDRWASFSSTEKKEEAKNRFQEIQEAYSVLSDSNKRFLYDVGVYDNDDDDNNDMGDFLEEMAAMMNQTKTNDNKQETFEELQVLFNEIFNVDANGLFDSTSTNASDEYELNSASWSSSSSWIGLNATPSHDNGGPFNSLKRDNADMTSGKPTAYCQGSTQFSPSDSSGDSGSWRSGRKQKTSSRHDVSFWDSGVSYRDAAGSTSAS